MMAVPQRVVHQRRATITALPLYYSGHLLKKEHFENDFKKYYAELRGCTLFLYKDDTQDTYTEKLDLENLKSMRLDSPCQIKMSPVFTLTLHTEEVQLKVDSLDTAEEWQGYIHTVVKKEIPSTLQLLPGQKIMLQDILAQEKRRNCAKPSPPIPPLPPRPAFLSAASSPKAAEACRGSLPEMPSCFYGVTRQEAERMLEENPEYGSIIIRPAALAKNYALTLRQQTPSGMVMKNYRLTPSKSGIIIELDTAVTVSSLNEVLKYFLEKTEHRLYPFIMAHPYDTRIGLPSVPMCITSQQPKVVPQAHVAPMQHSQSAPESLKPPPSKVTENEYLIPDDDSKDKKVLLANELGAVLQSRWEKHH
ncbi:signal-transducing adaptor protein 1-like [Thalassophryne amazonica]|uniref:signal-transducing adaptor protein 1-like n=1 Tax=Thalassophryne amazonica TaxID=390379 RepID=UPI0014715D29|nr:signal-transducing adaptor protein 1-like [Thalassophryne amazonica]